MNVEPFQLSDWKQVHEEMLELEAGALANRDEGRRVGHYWLRNPDISPSETKEITNSWELMTQLVSQIPSTTTTVVMIGIGGSALGPQLMLDALGHSPSGKSFVFLDNTDPDGMERKLWSLNPEQCLFVVTSKSGGTKETRNGLQETQNWCTQQGISFADRAVAITIFGSKLDQMALDQNWLGRLPLWAWVGGRTSVTGMVGLFPLALAGHDWQEFLDGAATMDHWTRSLSDDNPALRIAHCWGESGSYKGAKSLVTLPYKDSLLLLSRYLQQLIMESIGKRLSLDGKEVFQGLTVFGNKGSTDQHAFVQQLRDGRHDFFVNFIAVLREREGQIIELEDGHTSGEYLLGFLLGTRNALTEAKRASYTIVLPEVSARTMGIDRTLRAHCWILCIQDWHQRLPPTRCRSWEARCCNRSRAQERHCEQAPRRQRTR